MALTMTDDDEAGHRLVVDTVRLDAVPEFLLEAAEAFASELDATRARVAELEAKRAHETQHLLNCCAERDTALAAREAECTRLIAALYPLVVGCLMADANEDAPEFVNGEAERGRDALPKCGRCGGCGALDGVEYVDVVIPEAVRCPDCEGWGFLSRPPGSDAALRAMLEGCARLTARMAFSASDAGGDYETFAKVDLPLIPARLLPPATQAQGENERENG